VQLHWSTARYAPWQEAALLDGLADLVQAQQVDELGVSNVGPRRLRWMQARLRERGVKLSSVQIQWSLLSPGVAPAQELLDLCQSLDIEVLAYSPLAFGVLGCTPGETPRPSTWLRQRLFRRLLPESLQIRQLLAAIARERGVSMVQVALNWCRATGTTPIPWYSIAPASHGCGSSTHLAIVGG
jgi:pyridoxine 4-dehydrogenase